MAYSTRVNWEPLRSIDSSTLNGTFQAVGTPLANSSYKIKLVNNSNVLVTVSIDGTNTIDVAPSNSFWLYDENVTKDHEGLPAGTQIYVKGSAGTGLIYLVSQYLIVI